MANATEGVKALVEEVLREIPAPYTEDVTEEVFYRIEHNENWSTQYRELTASLKEDWVVNNWVGQYTKILTGLKRGKQVKTSRTSLAKSYSKLIP